MAGADQATAARWTIQHAANHAGATISNLSGVSCPSASACTAVGNYADSLSAPENTLAERSTASGWAIQSSRHPSTATGSNLSGVSCPSAIACTAVGNYSKSGGIGLAFAEVWNGSSWRLQTTVVPAGTADSEFRGVSCTSASACTAIGSYMNRAGTALALAERWNGTNWSLQTIPKPAGVMFSRLYGVSCVSPRACTAVGYYATNAAPVARTFAERWNGSSWRLEKTPVPAGATNSELYGVSCTSLTACTAVGSYGNSAGAMVTLSETWNGSSWRIQTTPNPAGIVEGELSGVSCTSVGACIAVGYYSTSDLGLPIALAERRQGNSWRVQALPDKAGATATVLFGVSCTSAKGCTAVGYYENSARQVLPLAERYS